MAKRAEELIPTRTSLIARLKNWQDQASWELFFNTYWKLIYGVARQAGLTDAEAQDVVQETLLAVAKHMPGFRYDPAIGSFKGWLLQMTRWRIADQFRKRGPFAPVGTALAEEEIGTSLLERQADPTIPAPEEIWEAEWEQNLLEAALSNVRLKLDPERFQIFDCYVRKGWPAEKVADLFGIPAGQVYLAKHRITGLLKAEIQRLEKEVT